MRNRNSEDDDDDDEEEEEDEEEDNSSEDEDDNAVVISEACDKSNVCCLKNMLILSTTTAITTTTTTTTKTKKSSNTNKQQIEGDSATVQQQNSLQHIYPATSSSPPSLSVKGLKKHQQPDSNTPKLHTQLHHRHRPFSSQRLRRRQASVNAAAANTTTTTASQTKSHYTLQHFYTLMFCLLLGTLAPTPAHADWLMDCGDCHCKWNSGKKTADCKNLSLSAIPENLSSEVQVLDLSFNRIPYLEQNAFLTAQLQNLHKLFIRNSTVQQIDPRSFTQLEILIELDLSNNLLRTLQPNLFARLIKVRALVLNGNLLESLGDGVFQNLKYLHKVELKHNRLVRFGTQVFLNVPLLSQIYLDSNQLSFLRKESFESLKRLTALSLDQNPWNCTCELQIFRDFVLKRNLYTPPTSCYYPLHLRGMLWIADEPEAFACKPKIIYPARGASINTSKENVTLICRVHASPNTMIAWDYNKQTYRVNAANSATHSGGSGVLLAPAVASSSHSTSGSGSSGSTSFSSSTSSMMLGSHQQNQRVHIQLLRDEQSKEKEFGRDVFISRLTILGAEKSDEGIYTCLAENAGGKDAVQMSLLVQKPGPRDLLLQGNLIIVICLMALGLLSVSVFLAMVTCCIYKRFKNINPGHHRHLHHLNMNTADQITTTALGEHHGTTGSGTGTTNMVVTGGTDVTQMLGGGGGVDGTGSVGVGSVVVGGGGAGTGDDANSLSHYKQHKTLNLNGGTQLKSANSKYADVIKQHQVGVNSVHADNGLIVGYVSGGGIGGGNTDAHHAQPLRLAGGGDAEKAYLERNIEDTLNLKYPHGNGTQSDELNYAAIAHTTSITATTTSTASRSNSSGGTGATVVGNSKYRNISPSGNNIEMITGRIAAEYQPDLLPAYSSKQTLQQQQQHLYSPIKSTRIINSTGQQQHQQQQQQQTSTTTTTTAAAPAAATTLTRSKYNINVQEYLQAKYGTIGSAVKGTVTSTNAYNSDNRTNKREAPSIPLSSSASLTTAGYAPSPTGITGTVAVAQESGFSTLQRHCKSLGLSHTQRNCVTTTPTDNTSNNNSNCNNSSSSSSSAAYEYRQPPPPPYNATHRTNSSGPGSGGTTNIVSGLLSLQRRTNSSNSAGNNSGGNGIGIGSVGIIEPTTDYGGHGMGVGVGVDINSSGTTLTQTIVTASPSLNFLTTTGSYTPRRQLL